MKISSINFKTSPLINNGNISFKKNKKYKREEAKNLTPAIRLAKDEIPAYQRSLFGENFPFNVKMSSHEIGGISFIYDSSKNQKGKNKTEKINLSQLEEDNQISISLNKKGKNKETVTNFVCSFEPDGLCGCEHKILKGAKTKEISMYWKPYKDNFITPGKKDDLVLLKKSLKEMAQKITADEYVEDYGSDPDVNFQLNRAIEYLEKETGK